MFSKTLPISKVNCWHHSPRTSQTNFTHPLKSADRILRDKQWRTLAKGDDLNDNEPVDIDALAARLAAEAARLQNEANQINLSSSEDEDTPNPLDTIFNFGSSNTDDFDPNGRPATSKKQDDDDDFVSPFGLETKAQEADVLSEVGDGGFSASEFELLSELGQISIQQVEAPVTDDDSPFPSTSGQRTARAAVIAYTASYYSGMPFQDPVVTLMKEYLPGARAVACNELQILKHLCGMPDIDEKWRAAAAPLSSKPPVVELLGYFLAGPSERAVLADPSIRLAPAADTIWIVQKWESCAPLTMYPSTQQTSGFGLGRLFGGNTAAQRDRTKMLKAITAGALKALGYVHDRGVIHGSIGSGSLLVSTFNDSDWLRLVVKIDNFGFARRVTLPRLLRGSGSSAKPSLFPGPIPIPEDADDSPLSLGQKSDRRQLAVVLFECILGALSTSGPSEFTSAESVQRVLGEVFQWDFDRYRQYIEDEEEWEAVGTLLSADDDAGWQLLKQLIDGNAGASRLLAESIFCEI